MFKKATFVLVMYVLSCMPLFGQANAGTPSWSAYDVGATDTVDIQNLSVSLNIPVMSKSGAFPFGFGFSGGDSYVYATGGSLYPGIVKVPLADTVNGILGYTGTFAAAGSTSTGSNCPAAYGSGSYTEYGNWYIQFADGTTHYLPTADMTYSGASCSSSFTDQTVDGSGLTLSVTKSTVNSIYSPNGMLISASKIQDSNGNKISVSGGVYTDTLGVTALSGYQWYDVSGTNPSISVTQASPNLVSSFGCTGALDYSVPGFTLPTQINFTPDSSSVDLTWEPNGSGDITGRLQEIQLRTGGTVTFNYNPTSGANGGLNCTYFIPTNLTRTTSDGTVSYAASFSSIGSGRYKEVVTKLDIAKNKTVYTFYGFSSTGALSFPYTPTLQSVYSYINTGTVASPAYGSTANKIVTYVYNGSSSALATALPITQVDMYTTINGMSTSSRIETQFDGGPSGSCGSGTGGCYGNVTYSAQYDFGASTPTTATTNTYSATASCGASSPVNNKLCTSVTSMSGNTVASSKYNYSASGNLLTTYVSPNGGSSFLSNSTANTYNSNGTPLVIRDLANNATSYGYSASYYTGSPSNLPFATSITSPSGLITYAYYNSTGGVKTKDVDAAGNAWLYGYTDPWNRITSITDPLSNVKNQSYSPTSLSSTFSFNSSNSVQNIYTTLDGYGRTTNVQKQQGPSSSNYDTATTSYFFTGGGTPNQAGVTNYIPCTAASAGTCSGTANQTFHDMLGRVGWTSNTTTGEYVQTQYNYQDVTSTLYPAPAGENGKSIQNEYNGLGWLLSSCLLSSTVTGNVACGQANGSFNGILDSYVYNFTTGYSQVQVTRGSQTRTKISDGMRRVTTVTEPETSGATVSNYYDTVPSVCSSYASAFSGKLIASVAGNGNYQCFNYDTNGRVTDIKAGYSGAVCTLARRFRYDSTSNGYVTAPSGVVSTNMAGRLIEAETDNCLTGANLVTYTDEWFNDDKDGNQTDIWEKTPNSTQYYHSTSTYSGPDLLTVDLASPSYYTMTYGHDGEGRPNSLKNASITVVPTSGVTYNAASQPTLIDIHNTSTDSDAYTYDSSDRLTNATFTLNNGTAKTWSETLTWNANNTLERVGIVDGFNSGGTQYCTANSGDVSTAGYDDLARLTGFACGTSSSYTGSSVMSQTFSLDQYDNVTQAGSFAFAPGYSSSTNQESSPATYDASGNQTKDVSGNLYTYDQFNKLLSVNLNGTGCSTSGECTIYDAFGRIVEVDSGSSNTEYWYTQGGGKVYMNGATIYSAYWPSPGGGTFYDYGNNSDAYYMHKDWRGNAPFVSTIAAHTYHSDMAFAPYGEIYNLFGTGNVNTEMFNFSLQGITSSLFDTPNRELSSTQGRWLNPDPAGSGWNQYAYGTNPLTQTDPSGLVTIPPSWYLGFAGAGGLFFGGVQVAWPTSPASGTVGADLNWGPPTAPGSATGLGSLSSGGGSDYPGTINLQEDACIGCNDPGTTDMGGNSTQGDLGLGIYFMFGSYGLYPGPWNPALGNGFWVNGQQSPRPYISKENADANGWYSTEGPWFRGPDGTACNAAGACYYFNLQGNGTNGGLNSFITGLLTGNFTAGSYNIDTGEMQTIDSVIDHLNDPGDPHPGMGMPFQNFIDVNQERTLAPYSFSENNSYSCVGPPGLSCVP